jgi:hypothetical protein
LIFEYGEELIFEPRIATALHTLRFLLGIEVAVVAGFESVVVARIEGVVVAGDDSGGGNGDTGKAEAHGDEDGETHRVRVSIFLKVSRKYLWTLV